ncbi:MAG: sugar phosphate isomerase/epimerase [Chloroflexi bacterium]|nr:sugar phosphate isomerase/epimerase [Chloroflexota bacterium]
MRKIGIEIFYWIDNWADDQVPYFDRAKACGYEGVEISLVAGPDMDFSAMRNELDRLDLAVFASTGLSPETDITSPDAAVRAAGIDYLQRCLEAAQRVGSPVLGGVTYAPWLYFPDAVDLRPFRDRSANALRKVAQTANNLGVTICMEILNRFETFMFNTVAEGKQFLQQVDHPAVKLQLDTYHMNMEEDSIAAAIRLAGDQLGHFHCAASNRKLPGQGHINWTSVKTALDDIGYDGWMVVETFPNPTVETGRTVNTWRPLVKNFDAEAKQTAAFLREQVC